MNEDFNQVMLLKGIERGAYPDTLYKYRTIKSANRIIDDLAFWFAQPDSFNDPFDCSLDEVKHYTEGDFASFLASPATSAFPQVIKQLMVRVYQLRPDIMADMTKTFKNQAINQQGILSLSKIKDDILMWSHYADEHKGVVIGLELSQDPAFFLMPEVITYVDRYEPLNYMADPYNSVSHALSYKSTHWEYEQEVRVYKVPSRAYQISPAAIKDISFGLKTSNEDVLLIKEACENKKLTHVKFYKAEKVHGAFRMEFRQV